MKKTRRDNQDYLGMVISRLQSHIIRKLLTIISHDYAVAKLETKSLNNKRFAQNNSNL